MSVLIDTSVLVDYLVGDPRAARALDAHPHRSISAITWLEAMALAPDDAHDATRAFLRSFERLSINEAIADEALRLMQAHAGLAFHAALNWATARLNRLVYVTTEAAYLPAHDDGVVVPYRREAARGA